MKYRLFKCIMHLLSITAPNQRFNNNYYYTKIIAKTGLVSSHIGLQTSCTITCLLHTLHNFKTYRYYTYICSYCQFLGHCAFSFPLSEMREHVSELAGARLAVSTDVFDWWFLELKSASMNSYVIESGVKIRFLGGKYRVFKPGNPFKVQASTGSTSFGVIRRVSCQLLVLSLYCNS